MSANGAWQSSHDDVELDLQISRSSLQPPLRTRIWRWLYQSRSTFVVLWVLLISEAVRGILIPTQANFVKFVRFLRSLFRDYSTKKPKLSHSKKILFYLGVF